jgi:hypothetical protein
MTSSRPPNSAVEQKRAEPLDSARLATRNAFGGMTLCDLHGRLIACDYPPQYLLPFTSAMVDDSKAKRYECSDDGAHDHNG